MCYSPMFVIGLILLFTINAYYCGFQVTVELYSSADEKDLPLFRKLCQGLFIYIVEAVILH